MLLRRNFIKSICVLLLFAGPVAGVEQKTETVPMRLWYDQIGRASCRERV